MFAYLLILTNTKVTNFVDSRRVSFFNINRTEHFQVTNQLNNIHKITKQKSLNRLQEDYEMKKKKIICCVKTISVQWLYHNHGKDWIGNAFTYYINIESNILLSQFLFLRYRKKSACATTNDEYFSPNNHFTSVSMGKTSRFLFSRILFNPLLRNVVKWSDTL